MRIKHEQLVFKAIVALDEVVEASKQGAVKPTAALRFILAWLYVHSGDDDRSDYDEFYRTVQDEMKAASSPSQARYSRGTQAMSHLHRIARRAGYEITAHRMTDLHLARMTQAERYIYRQSPAYKFAQKKRVD